MEIPSELITMMNEDSLYPPSVVEAGKFINFPGVGKPKTNTSGYLVIDSSEKFATYGDLSSGIKKTWSKKVPRPGRPASRPVLRIWEAATPATKDFPYLEIKKIGPHMTRLYDEKLVVPMHKNGKLKTLQFIPKDGKKKRFFPGETTAGCSLKLGDHENEKPIYIAEGFSTAATIYEATCLMTVCAFSCGNILEVARKVCLEFPESEIVVCADDDFKTDSNPGMTKAIEAAVDVGAKIAIPIFKKTRGTDFNDLMCHEGKEQVIRCLQDAKKSEGPKGSGIRPLTFAEILKIPGVVKCDGRDKKTPIGIVNESSIVEQIKNNPSISGKIRYNLFNETTEAMIRGPWEPQSDSDSYSILKIIQDTPLMEKVMFSIVNRAIKMFSMSREVHAVQEYLNKLPELKEEQNINIFSEYFGAEDTPLTKWAGLAFVTAAVARIMKPGSPMDWMPILISEEEMGKTKSITTLFGDDLCKIPISPLGSKDFYLEINNSWGILFDELGSVTGSKVSFETIKSVVSATSDTYRRPYDKNPVTLKRKNVFIGTSNPKNIFDHCGNNRKLIPVKIVRHANLSKISQDRDFIFSIGMYALKKHFVYSPAPERLKREIKEVQEEFTQESHWEDPILGYIERLREKGENFFTASDFLAEHGKPDVSSHMRRDFLEISQVMQKHGFKKIKRRICNIQKKGYSI